MNEKRATSAEAASAGSGFRGDVIARTCSGGVVVCADTGPCWLGGCSDGAIGSWACAGCSQKTIKSKNEIGIRRSMKSSFEVSDKLQFVVGTGSCVSWRQTEVCRTSLSDEFVGQVCRTRSVQPGLTLPDGFYLLTDGVSVRGVGSQLEIPLEFCDRVCSVANRCQ